MNLTPQFSSAEFEFSHGRKPRGRGTWMFEARWSARDTREGMIMQSPANLPYSEAKRTALSEARLAGFGWVKVLP